MRLYIQRIQTLCQFYQTLLKEKYKQHDNYIQKITHTIQIKAKPIGEPPTTIGNS